MPLSRRRQTQLNFNPLTSSPPPALPSSSVSMAGQKRKRSQKKQTTLDFSRANTSSTPQIPSPVSIEGKQKEMDESSSDDVVQPSQLHSTPYKRLRSSQTTHSTPFKRLSTARSGRKRMAVEDSSSSSEDAADVPSEEKMRKLMTLEDTGESDSSVNARLESSPTKKRKVTRRSTVRKPKYTNDLDGFIASDSNEEEDEEPATKSPKKSSKIKPRSPTYSDEVEEDKEEEQPVRRRLKQRGKAKRRSPSPSAEEDHDEDEEEPIKSYSRNRSKAKEGESHDLSEREELQQELEDLQDLDSSPPPAARKDSSRDMRKASLADLLKARGAMRSHGRAVVHIDSGNEDESQEEEFEEEYEATFRDHQVETEADRDFIDEDDPDGEFGVPEIPLELSRFASAKLSTLFRHVVQWMLQREVIPGFEGTELQNFAFKRVGDKLTGLANNYISSVWSEQFTLALKARPEFCEEELSPGEKLFHPSCEACNRTNHPASWAIRFDKKAYDEKTLVEVKSKRRNNKGKEIAPMTKVFYLGSECANNARNAHPLIHWSYILFDHINEQWPAKEELKFNSHWDTEKKMKKVQKFVDDMQDNGQIKRLFRSFTNDIDVAQQFKAEDW